MVKSKEDYSRRMNEDRFKNFDKAIDTTSGQKQYFVLLVGLVVIGIVFVATSSINLMTTVNNHTESNLYEDGLNISYIPSDKMFHIDFSNPQSDTMTLMTLIQVPFDPQTGSAYLKVYEYSTNKFPVNITYIPSQKSSNLNHIVTVTLIKETGNYTYAYSVIPDTENKMWQGTGQYLDQITGLFKQNESI
jgi:hypothetical protein